jgi:nicotinate phosphoribosyltransferase
MYNCDVIDPRLGDLDTDRAYEKGTKLLEAGCVFSEYGTRRRRSYHTHDLIVSQLVRAQKDCPGKGKLSGTSNVSSTSITWAFVADLAIQVHLAQKYGISPSGTIAQ